MAFNTFKYTNYKYAPEHDLEQLSQTYNYLQQRHDAAVTQESALKKAIGDLQLNAEEDEFKQQLLNSTKAVIDTAMIGDFKGYALNKIIEEQGNLLSNPAVIGRLRSQQAYKKFHDAIDANQNLSADKKEWLHEINPYKHEDKYDANGNVIGSTEWTPNRNAVKEINYADIFKTAYATVAKEAGTSSTPMFMAADGSFTPDINKSKDGIVYMQTGTSFKKLDANKLRQAVKAAINMTEGANESFQQDYDFNVWKDKTKGANSAVRDRNNQLMSKEEYIWSHFNDAIDAAKYYNYNYSVKYTDAYNAMKKATATSSEAIQTNAIKELIPGNSDLELVDYNAGNELKATVTNSKQIISNVLSNNGINIDLNKTSIADVRKQIASLNDSKTKYELYKYVDAWENAEENYIALLDSISDPENKKKFDAISSINSGSVIPNNIYAEKYNNFIDTIFNENTNKIFIPINNEEEQNYLAAIGGYKTLVDLGASIDNIEGKKGIVIPREAKNNIYEITKVLNPSESLGLFADKGELYRYNAKGNRIVSDEIDTANYTNKLPYGVTDSNTLYATLGSLINYVDELKEDVDKEFNLTNIPSQVQFLPAASMADVEFKTQIRSGIGDMSTLKEQTKQEQEIALNLIKGNLTQYDVKISDDDSNNYYTKRDSGELLEIGNYLKNDKNVLNIGWNFNTGIPRMVITFTNGMKDGQPDKIYNAIIGGFSDSVTREWMNNTTIKAGSDIAKLTNFGIQPQLSNNTSFNGLPKLSIDKNCNLTNHETKTQIYIGKEQALNLREAYINWNDAVNIKNSGVAIQEQYLEAIAKETAKTYANIVYGVQDENFINELANHLMNNAK